MSYGQQAIPVPRPPVSVAPLAGATVIPAPARSGGHSAPRNADKAPTGAPRAIVADPARERAESLLRAPVEAGLGSLPVATGASNQLAIDPENCARYRAFILHGDVTYRPGVDVHGRAVTPADALESAGNNALRIGSDILFDTRRYMPAGSAVRGESLLGRLVVDDRGGAWLNGRPLANGVGSDIVELCRQIGW